MNFTDLPAATTNQPASALGGSWDRLPTVAFLRPVQRHARLPRRHGDAWAKKTLGSYLDWARTPNSLLVSTFDESETSTPDNPIPTIFAGPMVRPGDLTTRIDHYSMLRTIEDMYGLKALGHSADAVPITDIWRTQAAAPQVPTTPRGPGDGRGPFDAATSSTPGAAATPASSAAPVSPVAPVVPAAAVAQRAPAAPAAPAV